MSDEANGIQCRLLAIEYLIAEMLSHRYLSAADPSAAATAHRRDARNAMTEALVEVMPKLFPDDPASTALAVVGVGDEIELIIEIAGEISAAKSRKT